MSNQAIAWVVGAVIIIGAGVYLYTGNGGAMTGSEYATSTGQTTASSTDTSTTQTSGGTAFSGSMSDLAKRGGTWQCSIQSGTAQGISAGVVHVSGGKVRGDFTTTVSGQSMQSHMISDGTYVYTWSSAYPTGMKMAVTASSQGGTQTSGGAVSANANYSYNCQPETADASLFVPPSNITFQLMSM